MSVLGAALVDVIVAGIILISSIFSSLRGFAEELVTLLAWVLSLLVAFQFAELGAQYVPESLNSITLWGPQPYDLTEFHVPLAGVVLFLVTFLLVSQLHRLLSHWIDGGSIMRRGNRVLGFLYGLFRGGLLVIALVLIAGTTTIPQQSFWGESQLLPYFVDASQQVIEWMPEAWHSYFHYPQPSPGS